jgi:hypothetical protein
MPVFERKPYIAPVGRFKVKKNVVLYSPSFPLLEKDSIIQINDRGILFGEIGSQMILNDSNTEKFKEYFEELP